MAAVLFGVLQPDPERPDGGSDVFGKNLNTGDVEWFGPGCMRPTWSPDGTKIAYMTDYEFSECGAGWPNNGNWDIVVIDRNSQLTDCSDFRRVSSNDAGQQPTWSGPMDSNYPTFSPDSSKIAFASASPYLVPNDTNVSRDVFVKDLGTWKTTRVSTSSSGTQASGQSQRPAWSPDGGRIAFESAANTLVTGDTNVSEDIFVKNLARAGEPGLRMLPVNRRCSGTTLRVGRRTVRAWRGIRRPSTWCQSPMTPTPGRTSS